MKYTPPSFCPMCGEATEVVRHIDANVFEMLCENCKHPSVVIVDDHVVFGLPYLNNDSANAQQSDASNLVEKSANVTAKKSANVSNQGG